VRVTVPATTAAGPPRAAALVAGGSG
jgi:hypothetical protein